MPETVLVVLTKYADIFAAFYESVMHWEPLIQKIVIQDGDADIPTDSTWQIIKTLQPFCFSRNVNMGWKAAQNSDVLFAGDDVRFDSPFINILKQDAYKDSTIGISVPRCLQVSPFVCGYFKREMLNHVGPMDETFKGYGYDDDDFLIRMVQEGFFVSEPDGVLVSHPAGGTTYGRAGISAINGPQRYQEKWGSRKWNTEANYLRWRLLPKSGVEPAIS